MAKNIKFFNDARSKMAEGIRILNDSVRFTLGPKGKNVIIEQDYGAPLIVNDGVTIAKQIELGDAFKNLGAKVLIEAATKTNDLVGDGTTSAILVSTTLIEEGLKLIEQGFNPVVLRKGLNYYLDIIVKLIKDVSHEIKTIDDLLKVAYISSGDEQIANLIAQAYLGVGPTGVINVEESQGLTTSLEIVKGYSYERGYLSSYMTNDENHTVAELENSNILITDKKIISMSELIPFLEVTMKETKPLLIICDDIEQEVLSALVINKLRGVFNVVVTKAIGFGDRKLNALNDIATLTKATFIPSSLNQALNLENNHLGQAQKVKVTKDQTVIIGCYEDVVDERIKKLQEELIKTTSEYEQEQLKTRIAKLSSGIALIRIGALTEIELKEKKLRLEDALCSTSAALKEGIVQGGGKVFFEISNTLDDEKYQDYLEAKKIIQKALKQPFYQIVENAGADLQKIVNQINHEYWYDAMKDEVVKYENAGIIDPTSVEIAVISHAISVASVFLTTECAIVEEKKEPTKEISEEDLV